MSRSKKIFSFLAAFTLLGLAACGRGTPTPTQISPEVFYTQSAQTMIVRMTETALAASLMPPATETPAVSLTPKATNTPLLSSTPLAGTPLATQFVLASPRPTGQQSCDNYQFITDVTIPDGSEVAGGSAFVKTWRIKNLGPCTWNTNYHVIFGWGGVGTDWGSVAPASFPSVANPGDTIEVSIPLTAPVKAGDYSAAFRLQNDKGYNFGVYLTVVITVK